MSQAAQDGEPEYLGSAPELTGTFDETPQAYFVELSGSEATFAASAKEAGVTYVKRFAYSKIWKGLSVEVASTDVGALTRLKGVKAVYPVLTASLPPTETGINPELATAIAMTGADQAQLSGWTGAGVKVAVMDTGVDYNHPDLGGCFGPGCRVTTGFDFVGDAFNADPNSPSYNPNPAKDPDPDDCNGHGTHVAGIVGASGDATGVAPGVTFGAYRVFGCEGSTTADIMLAAMERALADGMDILNMSIGSAFQTWPQYPTAVGADALVDAGMVVVASIGNSGANGVYSAGAPGVGDNVIGVGSADNSHINALTFIVNPSGQQVPYLPLATTPDPPTSGTSAEVVYVGRGCPGAALTPPGVDDTYLANPAGKVALIDRGACTFDSKYQRAFNAGAVGVVIANNSPGMFAGGGVVPQSIFGIGISQADGSHIKGQITANPPITLTWTNNRVNAVNPTGGRASSFTSYGLNAELTLKPDVTAPGGLIRSTYPLEKGGYAIISGTSMASPHVAGAAALLKQARPSLAAGSFRTVLQNSADPILFGASPSLLEIVHRQGAGLVDIDDSIGSSVTVTPSRLSLGEGSGGTRTLTITNNGPTALTYTPSHQGAVGSHSNTNAPSFFTGGVVVSFSSSSVNVPAGGSATVNVTINAAALAAANIKAQYGGYIRLTPSSGAPLRVPYAGFGGDYQSIVVLTPTANGFPWLAKFNGTGYTNQPSGATYTMVGNDIPYFVAHFEHQSRKAEFVVLDTATNLPVAGSESTVILEEYLPRNSTATSFFAFAWDGKRTFVDNGGKGKTHRKAVPDGQYKVRLSVLKALGDPLNPAHTETWTSPTITIARP